MVHSGDVLSSGDVMLVKEHLFIEALARDLIEAKQGTTQNSKGAISGVAVVRVARRRLKKALARRIARSCPCEHVTLPSEEAAGLCKVQDVATRTRSSTAEVWTSRAWQLGV